MLEKGLVQVYTSESDQMNFAPVGLSLRAVGRALTRIYGLFHPSRIDGRGEVDLRASQSRLDYRTPRPPTG